MTYIVYACLLIVTLALQAGVVTSLPDPYRLFPLALVVGVIVLHERSLMLGALWIAASGFILEMRGLGDGLAFAGLVAAGVAVALTVSVFAKRSFWALLGIGIGTAIAYSLARLLWFVVLILFTRSEEDIADLFEQSLAMILMMIIGVILFGAYIRRFMRWSRNKFVSKGQLYDISLPQ